MDGPYYKKKKEKMPVRSFDEALNSLDQARLFKGLFAKASDFFSGVREWSASLSLRTRHTFVAIDAFEML